MRVNDTRMLRCGISSVPRELMARSPPLQLLPIDMRSSSSPTMFGHGVIWE